MCGELPQGVGGTLPPLFAAWVGGLVEGVALNEASATCSDCAMVPRAGAAAPEVSFDPRLKCCTYLPSLPNFLVGQVLSDSDPAVAAGRVTVEARIRARRGVTPLGLDPPDPYALLYRSGPRLFGRSRMLRCPHYLEAEGLCGIWRHRDAVCATWFCKYDRGALGRRFWESLRLLLRAVEAQLARWCVLEIGVGDEALAALFPSTEGESGRDLDAAQVDGDTPAADLRGVWGKWWGREQEFYRECAALVVGLSWEEIRHICGPDVRAYETLLRGAAAALRSRRLPERLRAAPLEVVPVTPTHCRVVTYSASDPLELSLDVVRVLGYFDGRPTAEALNTIAAEENLQFPPDFLRRLVDYGVLVPAAGAAGPLAPGNGG